MPIRLPGVPALVLGVAFTTGCKVHHPASYDSPMDTVLTYQSAFAADEPDLEYLCLSAPLKRSTAGREGYLLMRDRFFEPLGGLGRWILRRNCLEDNLVRAEGTGVEVDLGFSLAGREFGLRLVREDLLELVPGDGGPVLTGAPRIEREGGDWIVRTEISTAGLRRLQASGLRELRLQGRWKIDALHPSPPRFAGEADPDGVARRGAGAGWRAAVAPLEWTAGEPDLGSVPILLRVPAPETPDERPLIWRGVDPR